MDELLDYVDERVQPTVGQLRQRGAVVHESHKLSHTNKQTNKIVLNSFQQKWTAYHFHSSSSLTDPFLDRDDEELHGEAYHVSRVKAVPDR